MNRETQTPPVGFPTWFMVIIWIPNVISVFAWCSKWMDWVHAIAAVAMAFMIGVRLGARR